MRVNASEHALRGVAWIEAKNEATAARVVGVLTRIFGDTKTSDNLLEEFLLTRQETKENPFDFLIRLYTKLRVVGKQNPMTEQEFYSKLLRQLLKGLCGHTTLALRSYVYSILDKP
jgi:hypothetical protein